MRIVLLFVVFVTATAARNAVTSRGRRAFAGGDSGLDTPPPAPHPDGMRLAAALFVPHMAGLLRT